MTGALGTEADETPPRFAAVTVKVYAVPLVRPVTTQDVAGAVTSHEAVPGEAVTV